MTPELRPFAQAEGYLTADRMPHDPLGRVAFVMETIAAGGQIGCGGTTEVEGVSDRWSYESVGEALVSYGHWMLDEFRGEPTGWLRHQPSNRRRKYNAAYQLLDEWIAP